MKILGIETSCDETSAAVVENGKILLSHVVASSADFHQKYGGIVPEVAARKQVEVIIPVLNEAMKPFDSVYSERCRTVQGKQFNNLTIKQYNNRTISSIDAIAVTVGPGLIGSLLVGVETAKTLAFVWNKPIIPVNHVLAHIYAVFLENYGSVISSETRDPTRTKKTNGISLRQPADRNDKIVNFPAIALVVSGGHTELYLMTDEKTLKWLGGTLDDAAGECFDKTARLLGLAYPGGPAIAAAAEKYSSSERSESRSNHKQPNVSSRLSASGGTSSNNIHLPRPVLHDDSLNFSFSGLKTAVLREWNKQINRHSGKPEGRIQNPKQDRSWTSQDDKLISAFSFEIQEAITDVLVAKTLKAAQRFNANSVIVSGGVAANKRLTEKFNSKILNLNSKFSLFVPPPSFCVDSASYIAAYAFYRGQPQSWQSIEAQPDLSVEV